MKELKGKTEQELKTLLKEKREALRVFRFSVTGGKVKNVHGGRVIKKDIARIMTVFNSFSKTK